MSAEDAPVARVDAVLDDAGIGTITINQPARRNAMTYPMMGELFTHLRTLGAEPACRVVILTGAGDTFCAGTDLVHLESIPAAERGFRGELHDPDGWWNIVACPKPVICAVDGAAVGMGAEWSSMADVRIATTRARFAWNFGHRGLVPDTGAGTWLLPRQIGLQAALQLLYSGRWLDADEALALGYVARVVAPEDLEDAVRREAQSYLASGPEALARTKQLAYAALGAPVGEHQRRSRDALLACFTSDEHAEGVRAFRERRDPRFG